MGLFSRTVRSLENPEVSIKDWDDLAEFMGERESASGERVNRKTALRHSAVYRGVNLIATSVAKLALNVWDRETREIDRAHPAYRLLRRRANAEMTAFVFKQTLVGHAILQGNGYAYIVRAGDGTPLELRLLMPNRTYAYRERGELKYLTTLGGTIEDGGEPRKLDPDDVIHVRGLGWDGLSGYSIIELGADELGLAIGGVKYGAKYFKNAASPSVVLEFPGQLSDKAYARLQANWERIKQGLENAHKPALIEEGGKISPFAIDPAKAQLIESRKFDLVAIANLLGLPVHKVGGEGRTAYGSLEQENQSYLDESLDGWLCNIESEAEEKLLTEEEKADESKSVEFNRQALVKANITQRYAAYRTALGGAPFMAPNEARARENMPPVPGGDEIPKPLNLGQGGLNNDPKPTPADDPNADEETVDPLTEQERALRAAHRQLLQDAVRRMCRRLGVHVAKRKADEAKSWLATCDAEHGDVVREALGPIEAVLRAAGTLREWRLDEWFFEAYRREFAGGPDAARIESQLPRIAAEKFLPGE